MSISELRYAIRWAAEAAGDDVTELAMVNDLLEELGPDAELLSRRAHLRKTTGLSFSGLDDLREAVRIDPESAVATALLAQAELWAGEPSGPKRARTAVRLARVSGDRRALTHALIARAMVWHELGDPAGAGNARQALVHATHYDRVLAVFWVVSCSFEAASAEELAGVFRTEWQRFAADGLAHPYLARLATEEALILLDLGRLPELRERLRYCLGAPCGPMADTKVRLISAQLAARQGRLDEAAAHLARAEEIFAEQSGFLPFDFDLVRAELAAAVGAADRVMAALHAAEEAGNQITAILPLAAGALADQAEDARDRGDDPAEAVARLTELRRRYPQVDPPPHGYFRFQWAEREAGQERYDAEAARAVAGESAYPQWCRAADAAQRASLAWDEAYCRWRQAQAGLGTSAHRRPAVEALRRAHELAESLGSAPLLAEVAALAAGGRVEVRAPADLPEPTSQPLPALTAREREILPYLLAGRTYPEIAKVLVISEKTVSVHVANMLRKTGTANRTDLAILVQRLTRP